MSEQKISIIPNSTQTPNIIFDEWMRILSDVELRIVLVITRQTIGWVENKETGRRKEKDWISHTQLELKTYRGRSSLSKALKKLIDQMKIIEAYDETGNLLDNPQKRMSCGKKIFYRLNTNQKQATLFPTRPKFRRVMKKRGKSKNFFIPVQNLDAQNLDPTKETHSYKSLAKASKLDLDDKNQGKNGLKADKADKPKIPTNALIGAFGRYCEAIRGVKPEFVRFKDGNLIKCALKYLSLGQIELLFIWFLREKVLMNETIGAALCTEVIADFIETSHKEYGFYRRLEKTALILMKKTEQEIKIEASEMVERLAKFKTEAFKNILTPAERTAIQMENAAAERAMR